MLSPAGTCVCTRVCVCTLAFIDTPSICLHFSSISYFFPPFYWILAPLGFVEYFGLLSLPSALLLRLSLCEHACRCISRRMSVYKCMCVWAGDCVRPPERLTASPFSSTCLSFSSYLYLPKGSVPEGLWQFYLSNVCLHFLLCVSVCLSLLLVWSHTHLKFPWLVSLLGLEWNKVEMSVWGTKRVPILVLFFWGHQNLEMSDLNEEHEYFEDTSKC